MAKVAQVDSDGRTAPGGRLLRWLTGTGVAVEVGFGVAVEDGFGVGVGDGFGVDDGFGVGVDVGFGSAEGEELVPF